MKSLWRYAVVIAALMAACLLLAACGDEEEDEGATATATPAATEEATPTEAPGVTATPATTPSGRGDIGVESIWDASEDQDTIRQLHQCDTDRLTECVTTIMEESGASSQAMDFWRLTEWFLADFTDMGMVDLGTIVHPWRANENVQLALLNGTPLVVYPEEEGQGVAIEGDPNYNALLASFPDLSLWPSGSVFESISAGEQGGQRFVLQFRLVDGCRACSTGYFARVALDFAADGTYLGIEPQPLGLCSGQGADVTPVDASIPSCPGA